jgi:ribonucleoside-triphosphate reductase
MDLFWYILNDRLELCHRALRVRHEHLRGVKSDVAPILWQHGALARLQPGETIDSLLYNGYSTLSLGYAGLYECVKYMTGYSHTDEENGGKEFAMKVMKALNEACAKWKQVEKIDYSLYGTPMESTTYKFAKCLQKRFGIIQDVTDHNYITNSYHVNVRENIDAFKKLDFEADFQQLSPGGAISYVELPDMQNNIPAVLEVIKHIYDTISYAELNTKQDYCEHCGYNGELEITKDEDDKTIWRCPQCGCGDGSVTGSEAEDANLLHPVRRVCGYISSTVPNVGRSEEIRDRVLHL